MVRGFDEKTAKVFKTAFERLGVGKLTEMCEASQLVQIVAEASQLQDEILISHRSGRTEVVSESETSEVVADSLASGLGLFADDLSFILGDLGVDDFASHGLEWLVDFPLEREARKWASAQGFTWAPLALEHKHHSSNRSLFQARSISNMIQLD